MSSISAGLYALGELGRRAACSRGEIERWRVAFERDRALLYPDPQREVKIIFPWRPGKLEALAQFDQSAARYAWMDEPPSRTLRAVPQFIVPYDEAAVERAPLFERIDAQTISCRGDLLTATLAALGRAEEFDRSQIDRHGRFHSRASHASRFSYLERPIIDEYGLALEQALIALSPGRVPGSRSLRLKLTHDIDLTGFPLRLRTAIGHLYPRRMPRAFIQDAFSAAGAGLPAYARAILETAQISKRRRLHSAFYWQASPRTAWDSGYAIEHPAIRRIIAQTSEWGFEHGAHPGYATFDSQAELSREVARLRSVLPPEPLGGRQHFLRWSPQTWRAWETEGMAYDSTLGYADAIGFRAGTAVPYHPWLLEEERESTLLEIPLVVMDCTPVRYMGLGEQETLRRIGDLIERCSIGGGVFTLLWHNTSTIEPPYNRLYPAILDMLAASSSYDWREDASAPARPRAVSPAKAI